MTKRQDERGSIKLATMVESLDQIEVNPIIYSYFDLSFKYTATTSINHNKVVRYLHLQKFSVSIRVLLLTGKVNRLGKLKYDEKFLLQRRKHTPTDNNLDCKSTPIQLANILRAICLSMSFGVASALRFA